LKLEPAAGATEGQMRRTLRDGCSHLADFQKGRIEMNESGIAFSSMNIHDCTTVEFVRHDPSNANSINLVIEGNGFHFDLTLFDLPAEQVGKLYKGFGEPEYFDVSRKMKEKAEEVTP
jgi:hypothetical protein